MLQAIELGDTFVRNNHSVGPRFLNIIYSVCLSLLIKNNEDLALSLEGLTQIFIIKGQGFSYNLDFIHNFEEGTT